MRDYTFMVLLEYQIPNNFPVLCVEPPPDSEVKCILNKSSKNKRKEKVNILKYVDRLRFILAYVVI